MNPYAPANRSKFSSSENFALVSPVEAVADYLDMPTTNTIVDMKTFETIDLGLDDLSVFALPKEHQLVPLTGLFHCSVVRDGMKVTLSYQSKLGKESAVLIAYKQSKLNSKYHIFNVSEDGNTYRKHQKADTEYVGKFRRNKTCPDAHSYSLYYVKDMSETHVGEFLVDTPTIGTIFKERGAPPRSMQVAVHSDADELECGSYENALAESVKASLLASGRLDGVAASHLGLHVVKSKPPFHQETGRLVLDFKGRGQETSIKNMQLVGRDGNILAQFAKVEKDRFNLDFAAPFNAFQAFGFALAQLDKKN